MTENNEKLFDNSERYRDLGYAISYYRKRKGLTQEQVAEQIGISRQHMGAIEAPNMVRAISLDVLFNIATVLEIEPYGSLPVTSVWTASSNKTAQFLVHYCPNRYAK